MGQKLILSLGSNIGDRTATIKEAVKLLEKEFGTLLKKSQVYETPPLFYTEQPNFYNCCVVFKTDQTPYEIFDKTVEIENKLGRKRGEIQQGPRTIDIDIILVGDEIIADDRLTIPHPGLQDRLFVLVPLADIYPELQHPAYMQTVSEMIVECADKSEIKVIKDFWK